MHSTETSIFHEDNCRVNTTKSECDLFAKHDGTPAKSLDLNSIDISGVRTAGETINIHLQTLYEV